MSRKIVFLLSLTLFFGAHNGVQSLDEEVLSNMRKHRHYDVMQFLNFEIDDFDIFSRQCYLALNVYLYKELYTKTQDNPYVDCSDEDASKNVDNIVEYSSKMFSLLNFEMISVFDFEDLKNSHKKITNFQKKRKSAQHKTELKNSAYVIIEKGISQYLWSTEKEVQIIDEYWVKYESKLTLSAFNTCYETLKKLPSLLAVSETQLNDPVVKEFGNVMLLMTTAEFDNMLKAKDKFEKHNHLQTVWSSALSDILQAIQHVIKKINFQLNQIPELEDFPNYTNGCVEVIVILKRLFVTITDVTQEMYLLYKIKENPEDIVAKYDEFVEQFNSKLSSLFPNTAIAAKSKPKDSPEKDTSSKPEKMISNLYKNFKIQPSLIRYYAKNYDTWTQAAPDESNVNHVKSILYESHLWLTVIKHNVSRMMTYGKTWSLEKYKKKSLKRSPSRMKRFLVSESGDFPRSKVTKWLPKLRFSGCMLVIEKGTFCQIDTKSPPVFDEELGDASSFEMNDDQILKNIGIAKIDVAVWQSFSDNKNHVENIFSRNIIFH